MKLLLSSLFFLCVFNISAGESTQKISDVQIENTLESKIDRKKNRRKKRINKKRKKACAKWSRRSYAG